MMKFRSKAAAGLALAVASITTLAACSSSGSSSSAPSTGTVKSGGSLTFALDEDVAGFNLLQADDNEFVLAEILDQMWPSVYIIQPNLTPKLNTNFVTSAALTKTNPQTVVYQINPKATWSDGVPINADDFIYNWQAQSGNPAYKDVGGKAFLPVGTSGYSSIKSVTGSNNGKTVTVVFSQPFSDWQSLFGAGMPMIPAHIAKKVGFNDGFQNFGPSVQVSGGPYMIQSYAKGQDLVEVRNPHYWGTAGKLNKIVFRFILDDTQIPPAVQNGEVNLANPALASVAFNAAVQAVPNTTTNTVPGLEFQHMDFNQANPYLAMANVRHAIAYGTNRAADGAAHRRPDHPVDQAAAEPDLHAHPAAVPGHQRRLRGLQPQPGQDAAAAVEHDHGLGRLLPPELRPGEGEGSHLHHLDHQRRAGPVADRAAVPGRHEGHRHQDQHPELRRQHAVRHRRPQGRVRHHRVRLGAERRSPRRTSPSTAPTPTPRQCGQNWNHYANPQVDSLFNQAIATLDPAKAASLYNQIDSILWKDMVTLPLFQQPNLYQLVQQVRQHHAQPQPRRRPVERPRVGAEGLMSRHRVSPARTGPGRRGLASLAPAVSFDRSADNSQREWIHH